jgi:hypothetical protein
MSSHQHVMNGLSYMGIMSGKRGVYQESEIFSLRCSGTGAQFARDRTKLPRNAGYSQRNTFAESAVQTAKTTASAATSPTCADHVSPFQIPWSRGTA